MPEQNRLQSLLKNKIFMHSSYLAVVSFVIGILNFVFNLIAGRVLGPDEYGVVYPLTALLMIISIPSKAIQTVTTDEISTLIAGKNFAKLKKMYPKILLTVGLFTVGFIALLLVLMPVIRGLLHIQNNTALIITITTVFFMTIYIPFYSLIQSRERFFMAGITQVASAVAKFGVGIALILTLKTYYGMLWGILAGAVVMMLILGLDQFSFKPLFDKSSVDSETPSRKVEVMRSFIYSFLSFGAFQLITYLDPILVRFYLPEQSGVYSIVSLLGKASFYIASAFSFVILPIMSKDKENTSKSNRNGLLFLFLLLGAYEVALVLTSGFVSAKLFAGKYPGMESLLPLYGLMFLPYAGISFLVNYYFMTRKYLYTITILVGSILLCLGIVFFHNTLQQVSYIVGIAGYSVLAVLLIDSLILERLRKK